MGLSPGLFGITGYEKCISGWISSLAFLQAGQMPQESELDPGSGIRDPGSGSPNKEGSAAGCLPFTFSHTMYCANANASCRAPLPSLPRKSRAWLSRLCCTICTNCSLVSFWPVMDRNCMGANIVEVAELETQDQGIPVRLRKASAEQGRGQERE